MAYQVIKKKRFINQHLKLLAYLEQNWSVRIAINFQEKIDEHFNRLKYHPRTGKPTSLKNVRSILVTKHNRIYYRIENNKIIVLNMFDTRINPKKNKYD